MKKRYFFSGMLEMESGLHIGGGSYNVTYTDSPVVKTPAGLPYIPGSSFKGIFRSITEKLTANLPNLRTCLLELNANNEICLTTIEKKDHPLWKEYDSLRERKNDDAMEDFLNKNLCDTCMLFGSPFKSSKAYFSDLYIVEDTFSGITEERDGVVIDRDSETAVDQLKFDYEVVPAGVSFKFDIVLEDPDNYDLGLLIMTLQEFEKGYAYLGGKKTRGLGKCRIKNLEIREVDFADPESFQLYLLRKTLPQISGKEKDIFFQTEIEKLFK